MIKINIDQKEIEAFDIMLKNTTYTGKNWSMIGYLIGNLRMKMQQAVQKEQESQLREHYGKKDKNPKT
jgi:hypothetical protein